MMLKSKDLTKQSRMLTTQEEIHIIHCHKDIIKTQNRKTIVYIGKQGLLLKKFEDAENSFYNVGQSRSTIYFKISFNKFLKNPPYKQVILKY